MRLYLAVAVLMLAFVAYTEAQDVQEQTMQERFTQLGQQINELHQTVSEKVKTAIEKIQTSEFATQTKSLFDQAMETIAAKFKDITQ